jgi:hypothetical protein
MPLNDHVPGCLDVSSSGREEAISLLVVGCVDEVTGEQNNIEPFTQVEDLDVAKDRHGPAEVCKHLRRVVDGDDAIATFCERLSDQPRARTEIQDRAAGGQELFDHVGLTMAWRKGRIDLNWAAIFCDRSRALANALHNCILHLCGIQENALSCRR